MLRVKIIGRDYIGWSIDKDYKNIQQFCQSVSFVRVVSNPFAADVFIYVWQDLIFHKRYWGYLFLIKLYKLINKPKKVISFITNDIRNQVNFVDKNWPVDLWVSPATQITKFLEEKKFPALTIPFYVPTDIFSRSTVKKEELIKALNLNESFLANKILIGSFQRDSLGTDLNQPKWQKNPDLLIEILKTLPVNDFVLVLAGPRRHYLVKKCRELNLPFVFVGDSSYFASNQDDILINNLNDETIAKLYNLIDLYIVNSQSEGGPKAILEAALSQTLICSTPVGLAEDFLHPDLIYTKDKYTLIKDIFTKFKAKSVSLKAYRDYNYNRAKILLPVNYNRLYDNLFRQINEN